MGVRPGTPAPGLVCPVGYGDMTRVPPGATGGRGPVTGAPEIGLPIGPGEVCEVTGDPDTGAPDGPTPAGPPPASPAAAWRDTWPSADALGKRAAGSLAI